MSFSQKRLLLSGEFIAFPVSSRFRNLNFFCSFDDARACFLSPATAWQGWHLCIITYNMFASEAHQQQSAKLHLPVIHTLLEVRLTQTVTTQLDLCYGGQIWCDHTHTRKQCILPLQGRNQVSQQVLRHTMQMKDACCSAVL